LQSSRPIGIFKPVAFEFAPGVRRGLNGYRSRDGMEAPRGDPKQREID